MNLIPIIAKELGVEIGQEFNIILSNGNPSMDNPYYFEEDRLCSRTQNFTELYLGCLIMGKYKIEIPPFKPKVDEKYWTVVIWDGNVLSRECKWDGCAIDYARYKIGLVFNKRKEAEEKGIPIMKQIVKEYENE